MEAIIKAQNLCRNFGPREALQGLNLEIPKGICFSILGNNGCGKSTFLKMIVSLLQPSSGELRVLGLDPSHEKDSIQIRKSIGLLLDAPPLPESFSLLDSLRYFADLRGLNRSADHLEELATKVKLGWRMEDPLRTFSRGMLQRVNLLCAIMSEPELLILDEPFTGLDQQGSALVEDCILQQVRANKSVLLVTHELERALRISDEIAIFHRAKLKKLYRQGEINKSEVIEHFKSGNQNSQAS